MRKIIAITHLTLDGIMQAPGGPHEDPRGGFAHGGWAMAFGDEFTAAALREIMARDFDLLLGRRTYEIFAAYWPYAGDNHIARAFNRATKFVVTRRLDRFEWAPSQPIADAIEGIRRLKATVGRELHVWGSSELLQAMIAADLIDEFRMWHVPVVLGQGRRLFEPGTPPRALELLDSRRSPRGVVLNTYRPAGPFPPPSAGTDEPSTAELARRRKLAAEDQRAPSQKRIN